MECTVTSERMDEQPRPSSSFSRPKVTASIAVPPNSAGTTAPRNPSAAIRSTTERGVRPSRSHAPANGATSGVHPRREPAPRGLLRGAQAGAQAVVRGGRVHGARTAASSAVIGRSDAAPCLRSTSAVMASIERKLSMSRSSLSTAMPKVDSTKFTSCMANMEFTKPVAKMSSPSRQLVAADERRNELADLLLDVHRKGAGNEGAEDQVLKCPVTCRTGHSILGTRILCRRRAPAAGRRSRRSPCPSCGRAAPRPPSSSAAGRGGTCGRCSSRTAPRSSTRIVSSPIRSAVASGPILCPKQVTKMWSTSLGRRHAVRARSQTASLMVSISTRLDTKPGMSLTTMPCLPIWPRKPQRRWRASAALVWRPRMTSTTGLSGTGFMKCIPRTRSGRCGQAGDARDGDARGVGREARRAPGRPRPARGRSLLHATSRWRSRRRSRRPRSRS